MENQAPLPRDEHPRPAFIPRRRAPTLGLLGLLAFAWLLAPAAWRLARRIRAHDAPREVTISLGIGLALLAFLVHGVFDTFLTFTPTALLFALCLGLAQAAQKPHVSGR